MQAHHPTPDALPDPQEVLQAVTRLSADDRRWLLRELVDRRQLPDDASYVVLPAAVYQAVMDSVESFRRRAERAVAKLPELYTAGYRARNTKPRKDRRNQIISDLIAGEGFVTIEGDPDWPKIKKQLRATDAKLLAGGRDGKEVGIKALKSGFERWRQRQQQA